MPWLSLATWLITFLLSSSKEGVSTGKAALMATAAGLGAYYLADPSNPDNLLGLGTGAKTTPGAPNEAALGSSAEGKDGAVAAGSPRLPSVGDVTTDASGNTVRSIGQAVVAEVGSTARSWGPAGTLGVVAGTAALTSSSSTLSKLLPVGLLLGGLLLITR